jgi:hypothetical protein
MGSQYRILTFFQPTTKVFILYNVETTEELEVISYHSLSNQLLFICAGHFMGI